MNNKLETLSQKASNEVKLDQDLLLLTIVSSLIASYAIKMDSIYVLIGSMLVSPLFDPIIATVVFLTLGDFKLFLKSIKSLLISLLLAFVISAVFWFVLKNFQSDINIVPTLNFPSIDNFVVAFLIGIVGTLLWIWPKSSNTSAGVAVAISLVPPIANTMFSLFWGYTEYAKYNIFIFLINILGIFVGSILILTIYSKGKHKTRL